MADTVFLPRLTALSQCLCEALAAAGVTKPCFCGLVGGEGAPAELMLNCDESDCVVAWVRMGGVAVVPSNNGDATGFTPCTPQLVAACEIGIVRCFMPVAEDGSMSSPAEYLAAAQNQSDDMMLALKAVTCCLPSKRDINVAGWLPIGPEGGVLGGVWEFELYG